MPAPRTRPADGSAATKRDMTFTSRVSATLTAAG